MKIKLLIATNDGDYAQHLSSQISANYADAIIVSACRSKESLSEILQTQKFEAALFDLDMVSGADLSSITLPLLFTASDAKQGAQTQIEQISKYQRISVIVTDVLTRCAKILKYVRGANAEKARITAVWSPAGGVGKTTVALSYAAKKVAEGKQTLYLNMEMFSSVPLYFPESGKSISTAFQMLGSSEGDIKMLLRAISLRDKGVGVDYFCPPNNYDDMYALSEENIAELITVCAGITEELVIDMSCVCDVRTRAVLEIADKVLLVFDKTAASAAKLSQFSSQHNVFENIREKAICVANKGAEGNVKISGKIITLPQVEHSTPETVYKTLSACFA